MISEKLWAVDGGPAQWKARLTKIAVQKGLPPNEISNRLDNPFFEPDNRTDVTIPIDIVARSIGLASAETRPRDLSHFFISGANKDLMHLDNEAASKAADAALVNAGQTEIARFHLIEDQAGAARDFLIEVTGLRRSRAGKVELARSRNSA